MHKPYVARLRDPAHVSHRGGSALYPENTLHAFDAAVRVHRTDVLELDVQPTRDGHVVVFHDDTLERTTNGQGRVDALTLQELKALDAAHHWPALRATGITIPALEDVLAAFPSMPINMELKSGDPAFMRAVLDVLRRHGAMDRVCMGHVGTAAAELLHDLAPSACRWFPESAATLFVMCVRGGQEPPADDRWDLLALPAEMEGIPVVDAALCAEARARGIPVHAWTVDDAPTMTRLLDDGVAGIMTDRPDVLRQVLDARR